MDFFFKYLILVDPIRYVMILLKIYFPLIPVKMVQHFFKWIDYIKEFIKVIGIKIELWNL